MKKKKRQKKKCQMHDFSVSKNSTHMCEIKTCNEYEKRNETKKSCSANEQKSVELQRALIKRGHFSLVFRNVLYAMTKFSVFFLFCFNFTFLFIFLFQFLLILTAYKLTFGWRSFEPISSVMTNMTRKVNIDKFI